MSSAADANSAVPAATTLPSDSRRYPPRPVVGVGGIVIDEGRVLLIRRGHEPLRGYWSIPGGAVHTGERLQAAVRRELLEETGLPVEPLFLVEVFERLMADAAGSTEYHYVLMDYVCGLVEGAQPADARPGDDADEAAWFSLDEAETLQMTSGTFDVIAKALLAYDAWRTRTAGPHHGLYLTIDAPEAASTAALEGEARA